jgi:KipI family sensor histidine kinase inhibitor
LTPRTLPVGDAALTVELGDTIDPGLNARVRALDRRLRADPFPGLREALPSYRSLLVVYDPAVLSFAAACVAVLERAGDLEAGDEAGALHRIPVCYGGDDGPDLAEVAGARGLTPERLVALHAGREYVAFLLGFRPGFAYLGLLDEALATPRRPTPRVRVPAGTVAIAGRQTGIYPSASPGGWNLIGRTTLRLFEAHRDPPSLIQPGDRVRFVPVRELPEAAPAVQEPPAGDAALEVLEPGLLTTVQDAGRFGWRRVGVTWAGPMDAAAHAAANHAVGNPGGAAALECTVAGPTLRVLTATRLAVAGADLGAVLHRPDLGAWPVPLGEEFLARAGNVLAFTGRRSGCRASLAAAGGLAVSPVLGSRATDLGAGFGGVAGRSLRVGDRLAVGAERGARRPSRPAAPAGEVCVRVILGPQDDHFTADVIERFLSAAWELGAASDRVGCRLTGPRLTHRAAAEIVTDGMLPGCVQVPPDGQPIVMMADAPTTGGYPKIATVITADQPLLAQLVPGASRVRFAAISVEEAQAGHRASGGEQAPAG